MREDWNEPGEAVCARSSRSRNASKSSRRCRANLGKVGNLLRLVVRERGGVTLERWAALARQSAEPLARLRKLRATLDARDRLRLRGLIEQKVDPEHQDALLSLSRPPSITRR